MMKRGRRVPFIRGKPPTIRAGDETGGICWTRPENTKKVTENVTFSRYNLDRSGNLQYYIGRFEL